MKRATLVLVACAATARADDHPPKVVTKALIRDVASGKIPLAKLVDPERGLIVIDYWIGCVDDHAPPPSAVKLCGDDLAKKLPALVGELKAMTDPNSLGFDCENKPAPVCHAHASHCEWGPQLRFTVDPIAGLQLESVLELETAAMTESFIRRQDKYVTEQLAKLRAKSCKK
jgi:hypothetical protein